MPQMHWFLINLLGNRRVIFCCIENYIAENILAHFVFRTTVFPRMFNKITEIAIQTLFYVTQVRP